MDFDWKKIVKTVAPTLGTVISGGNPLVGLGIKAISEALLGKSDGTEAEIELALQNAKPEDLLKLKQADQAFKLEMKKLDIDVTRLDYKDAASARRRQKAVKDKTPGRAGLSVIDGLCGRSHEPVCGRDPGGQPHGLFHAGRPGNPHDCGLCLFSRLQPGIGSQRAAGQRYEGQRGMMCPGSWICAARFAVAN